ncbi:Structural maintenance of chromosomes protein 5 [Cryptotrichosporon argae]
MASSHSPRTVKRGRHVITVSDDDSEPGPSRPAASQAPTPTQAQANGHRKRPRTSRVAESDNEMDGSSVVEDSQMDGMADLQFNGEDGGQELAFRPTLERGEDGYVAGSIVRVKLRNFMTYDFVEFRPGPHLNMIVGVNGTGKSSIAGAIAIGLGFPPKLMGRSTEIQQFVKQGTEVAEIEIEIKGHRGQRNPVVWRRFRKDGKGSEFRLNGAQATHKDVRKLVSDFGVQADNLCSFLPQDKVANFAKMNPGFVLTETMRAAGDSRLSEWYEKLKEKGEKARSVQEVLEREVKARNRLQSQVDGLAPDVRNFNNLRDLETDRDVLNLVVVASKHQLEFYRLQQLKQERNEAKTALAKAQAKSAPLEELKDNLEERNQDAIDRNEEASSNYRKAMRKLDDASKEMSKAQQDGEKVDNDLSALKQKLRRREDDLKRCREGIRRADEVLNGPQADRTAEIAIKAEARKRLQQQEQALQRDRDELRRKDNEQQDEIVHIKRSLDPLSNRLSALTNIANQREEAARRFSPSIGYVLDWIKAHEAELQEPVYAPPMITVNITDPSLAAQVEALTGINQRSTFITTNQEDYRKLLALNGRIMQNGAPVAIHLANVTVTEETANPPRPFPTERLHELGFDGYAIDFVDAPAAVLTFLASTVRMHTMAVSKRDSTTINHDAASKVGISRWATRNDVTVAMRSRYGRRDVQTTTQPLPPAKAFNRTIDQQAVNALENEIGQKKRRLNELEKPTQETARSFNRLNEKDNALRDKLDENQRDMAELKKEQSKMGRAHLEKERLLREIHRIESEPSAREQRDRLQAKKLDFAKLQLTPLKRYHDGCQSLPKLTDTLITTGFECLRAKANLDAAEAKWQDRQRQNQDLEQACEDLQKAYKERTTRYRASMDAFTEFHNGFGHAIWDLAKAMQDDRPETADELAEWISEKEDRYNEVVAHLGLLVGIDPAVIRRHERLSRELAEVKEKVERKERDVGILKRDVDRVLNLFNPALDKLVDVVSNRFSTYFERMNCSGEVRVRRVEGRYEEWGLEILVSYRDHEKLQILTENRQSGGERSLATVTYLLSLCEMSRTPFSLVDEINQGMDQRVERLVHDRMVEATCSDHAGQYFLITPKLLTDLPYHERMKVLVVNNGTYLPESTDKTQRFGSLKNCLAQYKRHHAIAA